MMDDREQPYRDAGQKIRTLRRARDITQAAFGAQVHASQSAVSQWEKGTKLPARPTQYLIADFFHVQHSWLFAESLGRAA